MSLTKKEKEKVLFAEWIAKKLIRVLFYLGVAYLIIHFILTAKIFTVIQVS